jgi:uroporphyrin-III C-methyltransferase/precorrin-2 dehydrogenase/sirohydrochlorin ferrochelatase
MSNLFPHFPVFLDLAGRSVVLIGGDAAQAALARQMLAAGAGVTVFDVAPSDAMRAQAPPVRLKLRRWRESDFKGASLVIAAPGETRAPRARLAAHAVQALFHLVDAPEHSDIAFGGVAGRGPLAIGVSAQGAPPALAEAIRARLERALPADVSDFLDAAARARGDIERRIDAASRDRFWRALGEAAFEANLSGAAQWDAFIAEQIGAVERAL